jgi:hypothetical protein
LRPYTTRKLEFRSQPCVFLGYSSFHKSFKCLDRKTGRIYIFRDVLFDENIFPFSTDSTLVATTHSNLLENHILLPSMTLRPNPSSTGPDLMTNQQRYVEPIVTDTYAGEDLVVGYKEQDASAEPLHETLGSSDEMTESSPQL